MKRNKDYILVGLAYFLVASYVLIYNNPPFTIILFLGLVSYHIVAVINVKKSLSEDKDYSVSKLLTKLDESKKEQKESLKRFISLSTNLGSGLLMIDEEGIIQLANKDINEYFNRDFNDTSYQEHENIKRLYKFLNKAYLLEEPLRNQIKYKDKIYDLISTPLVEKDLFKGCLILAHDITLIKDAEKYQKRFTADVSHELRTPLSAIKGFSEILARDENINEEDRKEFLHLISQESQRMEMILNDLMIISKMDRLDYELDLIDIDIKDLVKECIGVLRNAVAEKGLELNSNISSCVLPLDKVKMSQVILNIIKNAKNYTDEGKIDIVGKIIENEYLLSISDTGIGIKKSNYEKIFKRFYRVDKARSRDTGGSGLGLSISKNVVLKHGGSITVSSKINEGTTFTIALPIEK